MHILWILNSTVPFRTTQNQDHPFLYILSIVHHDCMWPEFVNCSSLSLFPSNMQPFVLMAATTSSCSTRKGSVPEMCMPSSWRWLMRKYDRWLLITQPIFFPLCFLLIWKKAGGTPCCTWYLARLGNGASGEGRTKKEKHNLSKDEHVEVPTEMQIFFWSLTDSWGLSLDWGTHTWLPNQTLEQRGNVIFLNGQRVAF